MVNNIPDECQSMRLGLVDTFCPSEVQVHKGDQCTSLMSNGEETARSPAE